MAVKKKYAHVEGIPQFYNRVFLTCRCGVDSPPIKIPFAQDAFALAADPWWADCPDHKVFGPGVELL